MGREGDELSPGSRLMDLEGQMSLFENEEDFIPLSAKDLQCFVEPGDLWKINKKHYLLCGDTSDINSLKFLLNNQQVALIHTDPPYNVSVDPRSKKENVARVRDIANDAMSEVNFTVRLSIWYSNMAACLLPGRSFYFWGSYHNCATVASAIKTAGLHFAQAIIWVKNKSVMSRRDFQSKHEWCFYGWKQYPGHKHYFNRISGVSDVWQFSAIPAKYSLHLTEKPVELPMNAIKSSTQEGESILDPFAGSGTTLLAADLLGRICYVMEIDPWYCSIILDRCKKLGMEIVRENRMGSKAS